MSSPRKEASEKFKDVKKTSDQVSGDVRDRASNPGAGRGAGGGHVSEGGEDTYKGTVRGGGATPRNVPMFGVGAAVIILILLILIYFVFIR